MYKPALNGSSMLERFKRSNASEIHNGIMFDFYLGLPHIEYINYVTWDYTAELITLCCDWSFHMPDSYVTGWAGCCTVTRPFLSGKVGSGHEAKCH